ncbi:SirB2 family protein [Dokdonella sp.]|uniref:SirB2 family protein n=1 Tax=Dokdonella sp. TaxID=2291710 RepID=UPI00352908C9
MIEFYPQIKFVHVLAVILSGSLFTLRGLLMFAHSRQVNHIVLRVASWVIDTTLLTAALMLITLLHQYPFVQGWLTIKVLLLVVYIVLGVLALKRGKTRKVRITCFFSAMLVYAFIISVAIAHNPWGVFARFLA